MVRWNDEEGEERSGGKKEKLTRGEKKKKKRLDDPSCAPGMSQASPPHCIIQTSHQPF